MKLIQILNELDLLFKSAGEEIYAVGGAVRNYLLERAIFDFDFATTATPTKMKKILPAADFTFAKFGTVSFYVHGEKIEITTFRREKDYLDSRHPRQITFVRELEVDAARRDFTMNSLYLNAAQTIFDFYGGRDDIENKIIRMIGDPYQRLKEDPLRILRALRFQLELGFAIEKNLAAAIEKLSPLVSLLNPHKVAVEVKKMRAYDEDKTNAILAKYQIETSA